MQLLLLRFCTAGQRMSGKRPAWAACGTLWNIMFLAEHGIGEVSLQEDDMALAKAMQEQERAFAWLAQQAQRSAVAPM